MKTLKLKFNNNQITVLTKNQIGLFFKNTKFVILFSIFLALTIGINIFGFLVINSKLDWYSPEEKITYINLFVALISIILIIQTIYLTVNCFITQIKNNIHTTELRYGYKVKNIYLSRLAFIFGFSTLFLLSMFLISSIFFAFGSTQNPYQIVFLYRLYISSFAWYGILVFLTIVIALVLAKFLSESSTSVISSILAIFLILAPAISSFMLEFSDAGYFARDASTALLTENYRREIYHDLQDDENFIKIYPEFEYVKNSKYWAREEIILGPKYWEIKEKDQSKIENYNNFYQEVSQELQSGNQITTWNTFRETTSYDIPLKLDEPFHELFNKLYNSQSLKKYNYLFKTMEKQTKNFSIWKSLRIIETLYFDSQDKEKLFEKFDNCSDEYFFIKTLNSLFLRVAQSAYIYSDDFASDDSYLTIDKIRAAIKKDRIANIFNPLRHFNLMFVSIDYKNNDLYSIFNLQQYLYSTVPNYNFVLDGADISDLNNSMRLKQNVPVEVIYLFYLVLGSSLIALAYLRFNKKSKK